MLKSGLYFLALSALLISDVQAAPQKGSGLLNEDPQKLVTFRSAPKFRAYLPPSVDLSVYFPPVKSQGSQGSCTAWATGYALRGYYARRDAGENGGSAIENFSPAYIYNQLVSSDTCLEGTRISDALRLMEKEGIAQDSVFPYNPLSCNRKPNNTIRQTASDYKIDGWERIIHTRLDDLKGKLADGHPIAIGLMIDKDFERLSGPRLYNKDKLGPNAYGHAMAVVGYNETKQAFRVFNSWGTDWGDQGYGWIGYQYMEANLDSAFVMNIKPKAPAPQSIPAAKVAPVASLPKPAPQPKKVEAKPVEHPQKPSLSDLIRRKVANFECFSLSKVVEQGKLSKIKGFVSSDIDYLTLKNVMNVHPAGKSINLDVQVRKWPQCEALTTFSSPLGASQKMVVETLSPDMTTKSTYADGDQLVVRVKTPDFPSYLYVTYLQSAGDAVHLVRGANNQGKPFAPNSEVVFGNSPDQPVFRIGKPYGHEMIMVMATRKPLFEEEYGIVEEERTYLTRFRKGILNTLGKKIVGNVAAVATYLDTTPKP